MLARCRICTRHFVPVGLLRATPGPLLSSLTPQWHKAPPQTANTPICLQLETAGDCYIVCGGLLDEDEHGFKTIAVNDAASAQTAAARRVVNFAYEMMHVGGAGCQWA